ncbi:MAG: hypothetical protein KDK97_03565 [Verrucomicrobiales bacterium]|nr:hypothetical protein [Verrucomicrobiales bacterium]MCP5558699.1 hypothetical protein [Verrucomicrobiaceae bacterium]
MNLRSTVLALSIGLISTLSSCSVYKGVFAEASPAPGTKVNWPGRSFKTVKAYCYDYTAEKEGSFFVNGRMHKGVMDPNGVTLSPAQVSHLMQTITVSHARLKRTSCYRPHHAFVFYGAKGEVVAVLEMCFGCNKFVETPDGLPEYFDTPALYNLVGELGLPLGVGNEFYTQACRR